MTVFVVRLFLLFVQAELGSNLRCLGIADAILLLCTEAQPSTRDGLAGQGGRAGGFIELDAVHAHATSAFATALVVRVEDDEPIAFDALHDALPAGPDDVARVVGAQ